MKADLEDYKDFTKRTCAKCGLRAPQPIMQEETVEVEVAQGKSAFSLRTILGSILGNKRSRRQLTGYFVAPSKRSYTRKTTIYTCEKCAGKKSKRGCLIILLIILLIGGAALRLSKSAPDSDSQSATEASKPPSVVQLGSPKESSKDNDQLAPQPADASDAQTPDPPDAVMTKRFKIQFEDCFIREVIGQNKVALLNKRPKSGYIYVVAKWSFKNETPAPLPIADAPSTKFVDAFGDKIDPDALATRKMSWELNIDPAPARLEPAEKMQVVTVFEVERGKFDVAICHAEFLDQGKAATLPIKAVFSSK